MSIFPLEEIAVSIRIMSRRPLIAGMSEPQLDILKFSNARSCTLLGNPIARGRDDGLGLFFPADCLFNLKIQTSNDEASRAIAGGRKKFEELASRTRLRIAHDPGIRM